MNKINKQKVGFKFGINRTTVIRQCGEVEADGRKYKLALVQADDKPYYTLRLYNVKGKFIKQLMFELWVLNGIIAMLTTEANSHPLELKRSRN